MKTIKLQKEKQTCIVKFYGITPAKLFDLLDSASTGYDNGIMCIEIVEKLRDLSYEIY
jgi:hypothetical protein